MKTTYNYEGTVAQAQEDITQAETNIQSLQQKKYTARYKHRRPSSQTTKGIILRKPC